MKKITKTLILVLFVSLIAKADFVDFNFAKQIARNHYCSLVDNIPYEQITLKLSHTEFRNGIAMYYVFDVGDNNGFVIISADDNVYPVLGYSFEKNFNESLTNLPPNFSEWMDSYSDQIEYVIQNSVSGDQTIKTKWTELATNAQNPKSTDDVSPLLNTNWDQGQYYNTLCPADPDGPDGHVWAGCVATSMAQVMKYHNHPVQGTGSHSYYYYPYGTLSANFGATTYNWASMPNQVYSNNTAVATLLYHCGVSVDMMYGPDGSGAFTSDARNSLVDYFSYSPNAAYLCKDNYTTSTWENMLKNQLDASQPMIYSGYGPSGGHAWVCDGYQSTNHFHFNWGWSGYANGYYYVSNLNPGGSTFTEGQCAIFNLYPESTTTLDPPTNLTATVVTDNDVLLEWDPPTGSGSGNWIHWDDQTNSGNGIGLTTGGTLFVASRWTPTDLAPYNGQTITQISFFANDDPSATYVIMAWTGSNAGTLIVSQPVPSFNLNQFNIIDLTTPIVINASAELWFGYSVTHEEGTYPAGTDDGPAFANKGDMISMDGDSWVSMSIDYGLDYNWNLSAYVESTKTNNPAQPMVKPINQNYATGSIVANGGGNYSKKFIPYSTKDLLGYNVYRDGSSIAYTTNISYLDEDLAAGTYNYYTTAVYDEGESGPSNIETATIDGTVLNPPTDLIANVTDNDVHLEWETPAIGGGDLVELYQHDGVEDNGYFQFYNNGYGVIFDLDVYPGATLEAVDFRHSSWGINGTWDYKIHIVDWDTYTEVALLGTLQTTVNDNWELDVDLGSIAGVSGLVGIFLEPMSNDPEDAYPCIDWDASLDGSSVFGALSDYSAMEVAGGDFLIDLWIMTAGDKQLVQPKKIQANGLPGIKARKSYQPIAGTTLLVNQKENTSNGVKALLGYNIYRDEVLINYTTENEYDDLDLDSGTYDYYVTAVYDEGESNPSNTETVTIGGSGVFPPTNLTATLDDCEIQLTWDPPGSANEWIQWDNGINTGNGIGLADGGTFNVASRWSPADLAPYDGLSITQISFFPNGDASATFVLKAWTGSNAGTQIMSQAVSSFNVDEFNEVALTSPILIDASQELWFGYSVTGGAGSFPAGCDDGPAIMEYGDQISLDGSSWTGMSGAYGLDYNWHLAAYVESADATAPAQPMVKTTHHKISSGSFVASGGGNFSKEFNPSGSKALLGYNIYLKLNTGPYELLDFTSESSFTTEGLPCNEYYFMVSAVYDEGESEFSNEAVAAIPCYPPENLVASVYESVNVHLESDPTVCGTPTAYNFYRDDILIGSNNIPEFDDLDLSPGTYDYYVLAVYSEGVSNPSNTATVVIGSLIDPPTNLTATIDDCDIQLTWDPPSGYSSEWIQWDNGENFGNGIGLTGGGTFNVASRWSIADLATYDGMTITKISFFPNTDINASFVLKAWTGNNAGTQIMSQAVPSYSVDEFNQVDLTSPILIDASQELWFGYEVTHGEDAFPAGCDDGPAIMEYGDQISLDGSTWEGMSGAYGLDYNWNLAAYVESSDAVAAAPAQPMVKTIYHKISTGAFVAKGGSDFSKKFIPSESKELLGYNLYLDGAFLVFVTEETLTFSADPCATYEFIVTAVYDEGESEPSNTVIAEIPCYPPENFTAMVFEGVNVHLECDPPVCGTPSSYNFYRDGSFIGSSALPEYDDLDLLPGTYEYYATVNWIDEESGQSNSQTINIEVILDPPTNLTGPEYITYGNAIDLMWDAPSSGKDLLGYNVYRSFNYDPYELQGYTTEELYSDMEYIYEGLYVYYVTAVYDEGESEPSNEHEVDVLEGIEDHLFNAVQFFPNPATEIVNIKSDYNIELLKVYSFTGQEVVSEIVNKNRHVINTSVYEPGLYIFQVDTKEGRITKRIVIR